MKISVIGLGKLGLCIACTLAKHHKVIGIDVDLEHINRLKLGINTIKEPGLGLLFYKYNRNIFFTNKYILGDIVFIVVPTPSMSNHAFTSEFIENALHQIKLRKTVVIVSTIMPGETARLQKKYPHLNLIYNPTFIALGNVIKNFLMPDFILIGTDKIGTDKQKDISILMDIYKTICLLNPTFTILTTLEAEIAKLALNCYITTKITFANQIGNLCYRLGITPDNILNAIGQDKRIGNLYFKAGLGYGGPCFPRDNRALTAFMLKHKLNPGLAETTHILNNLQVDEFVNRIIKLKPKVIGFKDLSYKKGTHIKEGSQLLAIKEKLIKKGYKTIIGKGDVNIDWEGINETMSDMRRRNT